MCHGQYQVALSYNLRQEISIPIFFFFFFFFLFFFLVCVDLGFGTSGLRWVLSLNVTERPRLKYSSLDCPMQSWLVLLPLLLLCKVASFRISAKRNIGDIDVYSMPLKKGIIAWYESLRNYPCMCPYIRTSTSSDCRVRLHSARDDCCLGKCTLHRQRNALDQYICVNPGTMLCFLCSSIKKIYVFYFLVGIELDTKKSKGPRMGNRHVLLVALHPTRRLRVRVFL